MGTKFIVEGALCKCHYGSTPAILKVIDHKFAHMNGDSLIATNVNLGNVFQVPAFGLCNINPLFPKPCIPSIIQWNGTFDKIKVNKIASPLIDGAKGTCVIGGPNCIEFITTGQLALPTTSQLGNASIEFQNDLDPIGESLALNEHQIDAFFKIHIENR